LASLPNLARRLDGFMEWLEAEPCTHPGNAEIVAKLEEKLGKTVEGFRGCDILSKLSSMCPACRLRLAFFQTIFNGGVYDPTLDEENV